MRLNAFHAKRRSGGETPALAPVGSFVDLPASLGRQLVPDAHGEVAGAGDEPGAVGAPGDGVDEVGVAAQLCDLLARGDVEQADGVVAAGGGQPRTVGAERDAVDDA